MALIPVEYMETMIVFAEYFQWYFSTAGVDVSNNYPYQIINSVAIPNLNVSGRDIFQTLRSLIYG